MRAGISGSAGAAVVVAAAAAAFEPYDSGPIRGDGPAQRVSISIAGVRVLRLLTTCEQGTANCNIWGEPRLIAADGAVTPLTDLRPFRVVTGWGAVRTNINWQGRPLRVGDRTFSDGFWIHADSEMRFRLDGRYERFETWIGEDADRANGIVRFQIVSGDTPPPSTPAEILAAEMDSQFAALARDIRQRAAFEKIAAEAAHPAALVEAGDRDPADVVLRRTAALLADLRRPEFEAEMAVLRRRNEATPLANASERRALFDDACRLRRRIAFSNPLLDFDRILFVKRHRALFDHMCDQFYGITARPGGGLFVLHDPFGPSPSARDLLANSIVEQGRLKGQRLVGGNGADADLRWDGHTRLSGDETKGGAFLSPALSPDATQILFAYVECAGDRDQKFHTDASRGHWDPRRCYHIFRVNADGTGLVQLTDGSWNDFDPCWLPNGRIAFISERRGGYLRCGRACPLYNLHDMAADGTGINLLSFHDSNEWHPSVTHDGRIVWTRWDYIDRHGCVAHVPWTTRLDGGDPRSLHGNFSVRTRRADMELNVRPIPGSPKYVATAAPHHGQAFGSLILIDPRVPDDDAMGPVRRLTPEVGFPESQGGHEVYGTPWPLSETYHLCVRDGGMLDGRQGGRRGEYGIYLIDAFGNRELLYRDPEIGSSSPIPLRPTPRPPVAAGPPRADEGRAVRPGDAGEGALAVVNVYDTQRPWPAQMKPRALRIYQLLPCSVPSGPARPHETGRRVAEAGDSIVPARWVLGTVPIEEDGSAHFRVPAYRELFFQLVDERGLAIQSMRSGTAVRDGETLVCQGCHEPRHRTPRADAPPLAMRRPPSIPAGDVDGTRPFSYPRLVQPVLDRRCVPCHDRHPDAAPNLNREPVRNGFFASYNSLIGFGFTAYGDHYRTVPGRFGARASKLFAMLERGHHGAALAPEELHRITLWLDSMSMFYGVFEKEGGAAQLRGEIARPTLE